MINLSTSFALELLAEYGKLLLAEGFRGERVEGEGPLEDGLQDVQRLLPQVDVAPPQGQQQDRDGLRAALDQVDRRLGLVRGLEQLDEPKHLLLLQRGLGG